MIPKVQAKLLQVAHGILRLARRRRSAGRSSGRDRIHERTNSAEIAGLGRHDAPSRPPGAEYATPEEGASSNLIGSNTMRVSEVMTAPVRTIGAKVSAREAAALMRESNVLHLVVVAEGGRVVGMLSDRDLRAAQPSVLLVRDAVQREKALSLMKVEDVMSPHPHTVKASQNVRDALLDMRRHKIGSLPVIDDTGHPIGIVTGFDVLELALSLLPDATQSERIMAVGATDRASRGR